MHRSGEPGSHAAGSAADGSATGTGGGEAHSSAGRFGLWPALQPTPKLTSLLSAGSPKTEGLREDDETTLPSESTIDDWRYRGFPDSGPSSERVERALGQAFDRLWRERPGCSDSPTEGEGVDAAQGETVDNYISQYFRHVAELSRESVYQAHQRAILSRMRDDVIAGDRSGNPHELEARIEKVNAHDRVLRAEIASLMRIVEPERGEGHAGCRGAPSCSAGVGVCCATVLPSAAAAEQGQAGGGKVVPGCQACNVQ